LPKKIYKGWLRYTTPVSNHFFITEEYTVPKSTYLEDSPYVLPKNKGWLTTHLLPKSDELRQAFYKKIRDADPRSKADDDYEDFYWKNGSMETRSEQKLREQTLQVLERKLI